MRNPIRPVIALVVALSLLGAPSTALACCDDVWSCAAAIASGGLTCAIEAMVNSVKQMKQDVDNLRTKIDTDLKQIADATKVGVHDVGDGFKVASTDARHRYEQALADAQQIQKDAEAQHNKMGTANLPAGALGSAGATASGATVARAPTPKPSPKKLGGTTPLSPAVAGGSTSSGGAVHHDQPCDDLTMLSNLRKAGSQLLGESKMSDSLNRMVHEKADYANTQATSGAETAGRIAASALVAPLLDLGSVLDDLIHHPEHLFNPAAMVENAVRRVTDAIGAEFDRMTASIVADASKPLEESRLHALDGGKMADGATKISDLMKQLLKAPSKTNCDKLSALLGPSTKSITVHVAAVQPGLVQTHSRTSSAALAKLGAGKVKATSLATGDSKLLATRLHDVVTKQQAAFKPTPVPGAQASFKSFSDAQYRGLTPAQATVKRNELLAEARRRYANDPALLQKVLTLIGGEADRRLQVAVPLVR